MNLTDRACPTGAGRVEGRSVVTEMAMAYDQDSDDNLQTEAGGTTTAVKPGAVRPRTRRLPPWNVLLHNDDVNDVMYVTETITELTSLNRHDAVLRMLEAHDTGIALLLTTHREHAELLCEQFASKHLTVTAEPAP
jgi:ATP-dependent Clp protease adaptor protein ClpS